jgi:hypothetical protein
MFFSRKQVVNFAIGMLPYAPSYLTSNFETFIMGFMAGLAVCMMLWGRGSYVSNVIHVTLWCAFAFVTARGTNRLVDFSVAKLQLRRESADDPMDLDGDLD